MLVNISEAKTNLSSLINRAYQGEKITIAKHNLPMIDLVVHQPQKHGLKLGLMKGKVKELNNYDWFAEDEEINASFYDGEIFPEE
ncbi:hypothetical protein SPONN_1662 [uncultured Candidatus Thioglobus sp.]|nr:hypothetical protein SPONN_1662 [uncultured Candidatus Thioglobus sp.]SMN00444.1 hypothetical protein SPONL_1321 [uncultured Candidatus Thioglobus sp.]